MRRSKGKQKIKDPWLRGLSPAQARRLCYKACYPIESFMGQALEFRLHFVPPIV